jgi:hypothetical protein
MPRDLADVLHHLIPGSDAPPEEPAEAPGPSRRITRRRTEPSSPSPLIGVPIGDRDVVRAAFTWNLAIEMARVGARAAVVAPAADRGSALWPEDSTHSLAAGVHFVAATTLEELEHGAREISRTTGATRDGGAVLVRIPPLWLPGLGSEPDLRGGLDRLRDGSGLLRWVLLLTSSEGRDLLESYGIAKLVTKVAPGARISVTVHGASRMGEAEAAFERLAEVARRRLSTELTSCGLLVDDLLVYRARVDQRAIGFVYPQSPAARSMREVAELVLADARSEQASDD